MIANAVLTVDELIAGMAVLAAAPSQVHPGDTVYGSDHGEVGTIEDIVHVDGGAAGYMRVPRGIVFEKDTFIPLDAVVKRVGNSVFINVPKLVVGKMPWGAPSAARERAELLG